MIAGINQEVYLDRLQLVSRVSPENGWIRVHQINDVGDNPAGVRLQARLEFLLRGGSRYLILHPKHGIYHGCVEG